jgi:hypothetical protein
MLHRFTAAFAALSVSVACASPAFAADSAKMTSMKMPDARFGGSVSTAAPKLPTTLSLVVAGGGPGEFKTTTLVGVLAGPNANAEVASLTKQFGAPTVKQFITTFDFVIADALRLVKENNIELPAAPDPDPKDGKALSAALYTAGVDSSTGTYNVEYMLDSLVSHPLHVQIMKDIDAKYGVTADANYHVALLQVMRDLKSAYSL